MNGQESQKTIASEIEFSGIGLHTGNASYIRLKPAPENSGIVFIRVDIPEKTVIKAAFDNIIVDSKIPRCSSLGKDHVVIHTVEHLMSSLSALGIDNLVIEVDTNELPGLDGSAKEYLAGILKAGIVEQKAPRSCYTIKEPVYVNTNGSSILIVPDEQFKISYTLDYKHPFLRSQFFSVTVTPENFEKEIAPSRTFCLENEARALLAQGLGKGANYKNTLVVGENGVVDNDLRFADEFARHKILDFIGDLYLFGQPIRGNVFAVKSGHSLNFELLKRIHRQKKLYEKTTFVPDHTLVEKKELDIHEIMRILPHRYPFLLVDRIVDLQKGKKAIGIKNVSINEHYFQGHFPGRPVMPGVLMIEAMAQMGGILVLTNELHHGKLALFMAADKVKFRKVVDPGAQLILEVEIIRDRAKTALIKGTARVDNDIVAEADILLSFMDASFLG